MKFVLLHEGRNDEGIKSFFGEVWELYVKVGGADEEDDAERLSVVADADECVPHCAHGDTELGV